jgi:hypothetical protein
MRGGGEVRSEKVPAKVSAFSACTHVLLRLEKRNRSDRGRGGEAPPVEGIRRCST